MLCLDTPVYIWIRKLTNATFILLNIQLIVKIKTLFNKIKKKTIWYIIIDYGGVHVMHCCSLCGYDKNIHYAHFRIITLTFVKWKWCFYWFYQKMIMQWLGFFTTHKWISTFKADLNKSTFLVENMVQKKTTSKTLTVLILLRRKSMTYSRSRTRKSLLFSE